MSESIIFSNTRGFQVKQSKVDEFVQEHKPAVFLIADHYQSTPDHLKISGYDLAGYFCRNVMEKGGVAIFVRQDIEHIPREDLDSFCFTKQFEVTSVELPSNNLVVSVLNRPNKGDVNLFHTKLDEILKINNYNKQKSNVNNYLMAGTFNLLEYNDLCKTEEILKKNNFKFAISETTHTNGKRTDDFIINFNPTSKWIIPKRFSDHWCIQLEVPMKQEKKTFGGVVKDRVFSENILPSVEELRERQISTTKTKEAALKYHAKVSFQNDFQTNGVQLEVPMKQEKKFISGAVKDRVFPQNGLPLVEVVSERQSSSARTKTAMKNPVDIDVISEVLKCLTSVDFMDRLTTKLSDKLKEKPLIQCVCKCNTTLTESLDEVKQQIQELDKKVTSVEAAVVKLNEDL